VIKRKINDAEKLNQIERLKLIRDLRSNQKTLENSINALAEEVNEMEKHGELDMAINVRDLLILYLRITDWRSS
jgi:hypothetical protein